MVVFAVLRKPFITALPVPPSVVTLLTKVEFSTVSSALSFSQPFRTAPPQGAELLTKVDPVIVATSVIEPHPLPVAMAPPRPLYSALLPVKVELATERMAPPAPWKPLAIAPPKP